MRINTLFVSLQNMNDDLRRNIVIHASVTETPAAPYSTIINVYSHCPLTNILWKCTSLHNKYNVTSLGKLNTNSKINNWLMIQLNKNLVCGHFLVYSHFELTMNLHRSKTDNVSLHCVYLTTIVYWENCELNFSFLQSLILCLFCSNCANDTTTKFSSMVGEQ